MKYVVLVILGLIGGWWLTRRVAWSFTDPPIPPLKRLLTPTPRFPTWFERRQPSRQGQSPHTTTCSTSSPR